MRGELSPRIFYNTMFKYLTNLFKKKKSDEPNSQEKEPVSLDVSHEEIKITPILPIGAPPPKLPKVVATKPIVVVKPVTKPAVRPVEVKIKPKQYKICPQCMQKINMTDSTCRFCLFKE